MLVAVWVVVMLGVALVSSLVVRLVPVMTTFENPDAEGNCHGGEGHGDGRDSCHRDFVRTMMVMMISTMVARRRDWCWR